METNQEHKINKYFFLGIIAIFGLMLLYSLLELHLPIKKKYVKDIQKESKKL